jgi:hypothetical protein
MADLMASAALHGLRAAALDPRLLKALLVAGAPLRLAIAANVWAGRSLRSVRLLARRMQHRCTTCEGLEWA